MLTKPGAAHLPIGPSGATEAEVADKRGLAPDVGVVVRHPAAGAVVDLGGSGAVLTEAFGEIEQRLVALGEVGWLGTRAGAGDQEITAVLEVEGVESIVFRGVLERFQPFVGREVGVGSGVDVE